MNVKTIILGILLATMSVAHLSATKTANVQPDWEYQKSVFKSKNAFSGFELKYCGRIILSDDDKDIVSISPNGYFEMKKSSFGSSQAIIIKSDDNGNLTKIYKDGRTELDFSKGKGWLEDVLPDLIHQAGFGGYDRIIRILKQEGFSAALIETDRMSNSSHFYYHTSAFLMYSNFNSSAVRPRAMYFNAIYDNERMNEKELDDFMESLEGLVSNSNKGTLLRKIINDYDLNMDLQEQLLETTGTLTYKTERGNTLRSFIKKYPVNEGNYREFFDVIEGIQTNSEKGNVLKPLLENNELPEMVMEELLETVTSFTNRVEIAAVLRSAMQQAVKHNVDYELTRSIESVDGSYYLLKEELKELKKLIEAGETYRQYTKAEMIERLREIRDFDENTKRTPYLRKILGSLTQDKELMDAYFDVIKALSNNMCKYNVLLELVKNVELDEQNWYTVLHLLRDIADARVKHGAYNVLIESVNRMPQNTKLVDNLFDVLEEVKFDSSFEEIIRLYCEREDLEITTIIYLLNGVEEIEFDAEKVTSLQAILKVIPKDNKELIGLYISVAEDIKTEYNYNRAMDGVEI